MSISIIIPTLNEGTQIGTCLDRLDQQINSSALPSGNLSEIIVVDGGSTDQTIQETLARGVQLIRSEPGRGQQQHQGAEAAQGNILLFLHCDTILPATFPEDIISTLQKKHTVAGAFRFTINGTHPGFRLIEAGTQLRAILFDLPYGDQALFMEKATYFAAGGFPLQPIMEDIALVSQLKKLGKIALAPSAAKTSARRWQQHGLLKTTLINQLMLIGRAMGIAPQQLARFYYAQRK